MTTKVYGRRRAMRTIWFMREFSRKTFACLSSLPSFEFPRYEFILEGLAQVSVRQYVSSRSDGTGMAVTADILHAKRSGGNAKRMLRESWRWVNELGVKLFEDYVILVEGFAFVC